MDKLNATQIALLFGSTCLLAAVGTGLALKALTKKLESNGYSPKKTIVDTDGSTIADVLVEGVNKLK